MNTAIPNTPHRFDLSGMKAGDWFMGCPGCWEQFPVRAAVAVKCQCGERRLIYDIKPENMEEVRRHNRQTTGGRA